MSGHSEQTDKPGILWEFFKVLFITSVPAAGSMQGLNITVSGQIRKKI